MTQRGRCLATKRSGGVPCSPTEVRADWPQCAETASVTGDGTDAVQFLASAGPQLAFRAWRPRLQPRRRRCDRFPVTEWPQTGHDGATSDRAVTVEWARIPALAAPDDAPSTGNGGRERGAYEAILDPYASPVPSRPSTGLRRVATFVPHCSVLLRPSWAPRSRDRCAPWG